MASPINIYTISRIRDEKAFNLVERHDSHRSERKRIKRHEIESLRILADHLMENGIGVENLDGFFYGFTIPHIGKEFDLLKLNETYCVNIELKSTKVSERPIRSQLIKNRHYLGHLGKKLALYSVVTDDMSCYRLSPKNELIRTEFREIVNVLKAFESGYVREIDGLFKASQYMVSPLSTPGRFIQGEYFLTQAQEQIKRELLREMDSHFGKMYFHLTGRPGTGKTLLLYDIAKTLSKNGAAVVIHGGELEAGQIEIGAEVKNLDIVSAASLINGSLCLGNYRFILIDESHRICERHFFEICESADDNSQICIFSSDPEQILSITEKERDIVGKIRSLNLQGEYVLSEKIRANKEISSFILKLKNLKHKSQITAKYYNVQVNYAATEQEAQQLLNYYRKQGFKFINYTKSHREESTFSAYEEDYDTHRVIGLEFDNVVMLMDDSFFYDEKGELQGIPHPNLDYLYPNLFYQGITRAREKLAIIILDAPELFAKIVTIL